MTTMPIPPIAVESAKEAAHWLLELCTSDAPPLDKDKVRTLVLDVIEALTDEELHPCGHVDVEKGCGGCDPGAVEFVRDDGGPWVRVEDDQPIPFTLVGEISLDLTGFEAAWAQVAGDLPAPLPPTKPDLQVLHRAANCRCFVAPVMPGEVTP